MSEEDDEDTDEATSVSIVNRFAHEVNKNNIC